MNPDPQSFWQFALIIGFLASIVANIVAIRSSTRAQKREVTFSEEFATREQHAELKREVDKIDGERRTSVANLHKKIEDVRESLDKRIDEIPGRTIALLNETKQLHRP